MNLEDNFPHDVGDRGEHQISRITMRVLLALLPTKVRVLAPNSSDSFDRCLTARLAPKAASVRQRRNAGYLLETFGKMALIKKSTLVGNVSQPFGTFGQQSLRVPYTQQQNVFRRRHVQ